MKQYFGNYLGLCINNNDPQKRGRVQVFIPHIMPTLYEDWNKAGEDIKALCVGNNIQNSLPSGVVDKLMKILPWAEAASPILGISSPGNLTTTVGSNGTTSSGSFNQSPIPTPAGEGGNTAANADEQTLFNNAAKYGPVESSKFSRSGSKDGDCGRGSRQILGALTNNSYFSNGIGGTGSYGGINSAYAGSLSTGNPYLQNSGYYNSATDIPSNYTPQIGDVITGTKSGGAGHVQVYIGNGKWVSDHTQSSYYASYDNLKLHRMNETGLAAVEKASPGLYSGTTSQTSSSSTKESTATSGQVAAPTPHQDQTGVVTDTTKNNYGSIARPEVTNNGVSSSSYNTWRSQPILASTRMNARSNNPGNLHTISTPYIGQVSSSADIAPAGKYGSGVVNTGDVAYFDTLENGIAQNINQINLNINKYGANTISSMASRWVGGSEANIQYAINTWSKSSGIGANETLDINNKEQIKALLAGISVNEGGGVPSNYDQAFDTGYNIWQSRTGGTPTTGTTTSQTATTTQTSSTQSSLVHNTDKHGAMATVNINNMAKGVFTYPAAGALLWVFFQEGNPLFPVYFAANYGESEWASAFRLGSDSEGYKPAQTPDNTATSTGTRINLGTGGIFSTDTTVPDDPTQDQKSLTIFGYDGSNMHFNEGYHQIFSKFDRRDSVEGDRWETTLGFKEEWIQGDSNEVVMGDVFVKIGNVSPPAVDAVTRIQQILKEAMEPLTKNSSSTTSTSTEGKSQYTKDAASNSSVKEITISKTPTETALANTNNITTVTVSKTNAGSETTNSNTVSTNTSTAVNPTTPSTNSGFVQGTNTGSSFTVVPNSGFSL